MLVKMPKGQPLMTVHDWLPDKKFISSSSVQLKSVATKLSDVASGAIRQVNQTFNNEVNDTFLSPVEMSNDSGTIYKWQDKQGQWHFSNEKPEIESRVSIEAMPEVRNLIPAPVVRPPSSSKLSPAGTVSLGNMPIGLSISRDQAGQLLKRVEKISRDAQQRKTLMDQ